MHYLYEPWLVVLTSTLHTPMFLPKEDMEPHGIMLVIIAAPAVFRLSSSCSPLLFGGILEVYDTIAVGKMGPSHKCNF